MCMGIENRRDRSLIDWQMLKGKEELSIPKRHITRNSKTVDGADGDYDKRWVYRNRRNVNGRTESEREKLIEGKVNVPKSQRNHKYQYLRWYWKVTRIGTCIWRQVMWMGVQNRRERRLIDQHPLTSIGELRVPRRQRSHKYQDLSCIGRWRE